MLKTIWNRIANEPVMLSAIAAAVMVLLVEFNVPLLEGQIAAIQGVIVAIAALFARSQVSPTRKLNSPDS